MIPSFALSLSFEGISLLRRMGPRWARIDDVSLDDPDFDAQVIALRDRAESLDPNGAQVALIIPNEQIRYIDQPDLGGDETARDVAIRASLDGATPYAVDELRYDHKVSDGRLQIAAVAKETLDEAHGFAVEHGFVPVCFLAKAPEGSFDAAVFLGKAKGWTRAVSRPGRPIEIVAADAAALRPLPEPAPEPKAAPADAPAKDKATEAKPTPAAEPVAEATLNPAPKPKPTPKAEPQPAPAVQAAKDAEPPKAQPAPTQARKHAEPAPQRPADTPRPAAMPPKAPAASRETPPAPAKAPPVKAPTPDSAPVAKAASPEPRPEPPVKAPKPPVPDAGPVPLTATEPDETPERPFTFSTRRPSRDLSGDGAPPLGPAVSDGFKPRFTPVATDPEPVVEPAKPARTGFFATPSASALLAQASAAADEAEAAQSGRPATAKAPAAKPGPSAPKPDATAVRKPAPAAPQPVGRPPAAEPLAAEPKPQKRGVLPGRLKPKGKAKPPAKPAVKPIPKQAAARAAALAATPVRGAKEDEYLAAPSAARVTAPAAPAKKPASRPNPLAKLAALRGPQGNAGMGGPALAGASATAAATAAPAGKAYGQTPEEKDRLTVFGARDRDDTGGKPRHLGLMLTALLLLFLAGVAAWSTVFLDNGLAQLFRSGGDEPASAVAALPESADLPAPATEPVPGDDGLILESAAPAAGSAAPGISARPVARPEGEDIALAAFDTPEVDPGSLIAPLAVPTDPRQLTPEEAAATYAATGIWQRSPTKPHQPPADGVDDVYAASIDPNIRIYDAVALPNAKDLAREPGMQDPGLPPPAGLTFDFDARDLIRATPEGALSPDGLRIFTGRPPVIPPLRGETGTGAAPAPSDPDSITDRIDSAPRVRPRLRPDDLVEQRERTQLRGVTRSELAAFRPVARPQTVQELAEVDAPEATDQAVRSSLVPVGRPRNMAALVDNADRSLVPAEPVQTAAAVAPRTIAPQVPSSASVARAATTDNAINLKAINLIGVYGTSDNRRALVRLANGKYQKVKVGDRLDGGRVTAIGEEELRYSKGSRNLTLKMPRT
ncbi:hypothetical protein KUV73_15095 [Mameliella alba]|nr:hypothetical protein [Mameliella alba]MBY6170680.1 hypothetical protein [Mameliella alba]MBY6175698.1 hypothetical protein [Mameliella alba]